MNSVVSKYAVWLAAAFLAASLSSPSTASAKKLNVVTATTDLAALAQEVGGDRISVESIAKGYQDPHFVEAKPSFLLKLRQADLLIVVGLQLEIGWLPPLITQSGNSRIQVGANGYLGYEAVSRTEGGHLPQLTAELRQTLRLGRGRLRGAAAGHSADPEPYL